MLMKILYHHVEVIWKLCHCSLMSFLLVWNISLFILFSGTITWITSKTLCADAMTQLPDHWLTHINQHFWLKQLWQGMHDLACTSYTHLCTPFSRKNVANDSGSEKWNPRTLLNNSLSLFFSWLLRHNISMLCKENGGLYPYTLILMASPDKQWATFLVG